MWTLAKNQNFVIDVKFPNNWLVKMILYERLIKYDV